MALCCALILIDRDGEMFCEGQAFIRSASPTQAKNRLEWATPAPAPFEIILGRFATDSPFDHPSEQNRLAGDPGSSGGPSTARRGARLPLEILVAALRAG